MSGAPWVSAVSAAAVLLPLCPSELAAGAPSSSIMAHNVVGSTPDELRKVREQVRRMLKENGEPPREGKWADIAVLEPVRDYKARHASTLLTFDAVVDAIGQIEAKRLEKAG